METHLGSGRGYGTVAAGCQRGSQVAAHGSVAAAFTAAAVAAVAGASNGCANRPPMRRTRSPC